MRRGNYRAENLVFGYCAINNRRHGCARRLGVQVFRHMKTGKVQGRIGKIWRTHFYNCERPRPELKPDPKCRFRPIGRFLAAFVGSIVPVGVILIKTGVTTMLDEGPPQATVTFWTCVCIGGVLWIGSVVGVARTKKESMWAYFIAGIHPPAWGLLAIQLIQSYN